VLDAVVDNGEAAAVSKALDHMAVTHDLRDAVFTWAAQCSLLGRNDTGWVLEPMTKALLEAEILGD
jgi:hypothetical protein